MRVSYRTLLAGVCLAAIPAGAADYLLDWEDQAIIFGAGSEKSYYMSVLYDGDGFPDGDGAGDPYMMWYASSGGSVKVTTSTATVAPLFCRSGSTTCGSFRMRSRSISTSQVNGGFGSSSQLTV